jgi:CRP/FNR family transcriptional regulator, anaerobic regulatory protein
MKETSHRCNLCPVRDRGICNALDDGTVAELKRISRRRFVKDGESIFYEGDEVSYFFTIVFGAVKLSKSLADGRQHIVELLYPPNFQGQRLESHHVYSAHAAADAELCIYPRNQFENFVGQHRELERRIFEMAIHELDLSRDRTLILARKNSLERVASFLLMVIDHVPEIGCGTIKENTAHIQLPFSRAEMADYLGLTLETVSRQLSLLRRRRIIELQSWRDIAVPDVALLTEIASIEASSKPHKGSSFRFSPLVWGRFNTLSYSRNGCA